MNAGGACKNCKYEKSAFANRKLERNETENHLRILAETNKNMNLLFRKLWIEICGMFFVVDVTVIRCRYGKIVRNRMPGR